MIQVTVLICALSVFDHCDAGVAHMMGMAEHVDDGTPCRVLGQRLADAYHVQPSDDEGMLIKCNKKP